MLRVQVEEDDNVDNENGFPEIVPENEMSGNLTSFSNIFSPGNNNNNQSQSNASSPDYGLKVDSSSPPHQDYARSSSMSHFARLRNSSVGLLIPPKNVDELNDSASNIKGKGLLASKKDVMVPPDVFAEGCKLLQAAALGNVFNIKKLLQATPSNIYFRDYDRRTALHVAASEGQLDIVKLLIEKYRAPINRSDRWGGSPLDDAHRHRHSDVVAYLRGRGASTGSTDQLTNLITAAVTGDLDEVKLLLEGPATNLSNSSSKKNLSKSFIPPKALDVNRGDYDARTALHLAAAAGHPHIISYLIEKGANVNTVDNWGGTPLDDAIRTSNVECIRLIKENGGRVGKDKNTHTTESSDRVRNHEDMNLNIDFSELDVIDKIGSGAFGEIFKCRWRGTLVAAKCIKSTKIVNLWRSNDLNNSSGNHELDQEEVEEALKDFRLETSILRTLRHPNIVMLLGYSRTDNFEVMLSELMKCSLLDVFTSYIMQGTKMPRETKIIYAQHMARGMNYLHNCKPPVIHRDLKPANLLIDYSGNLKISDFGLAKVRPDPKMRDKEGFRMTGETGSYRFMAPEVFRHEEYTETVDIYSFAMILYYLISGRPPWESLSGLDAVTKAAVEADRPIINRSWDSQIADLMQRCWDENPSGRPSFGEILKELTSYSKNALKLDLDAVPNASSLKMSCCVIS